METSLVLKPGCWYAGKGDTEIDELKRRKKSRYRRGTKQQRVEGRKSSRIMAVKKVKKVGGKR